MRINLTTLGDQRRLPYLGLIFILLTLSSNLLGTVSLLSKSDTDLVILVSSPLLFVMTSIIAELYGSKLYLKLLVLISAYELLFSLLAYGTHHELIPMKSLSALLHFSLSNCISLILSDVLTPYLIIQLKVISLLKKINLSWLTGCTRALIFSAMSVTLIFHSSHSVIQLAQEISYAFIVNICLQALLSYPSKLFIASCQLAGEGFQDINPHAL